MEREPQPKECITCLNGWAAGGHSLTCQEKEAWVDDNRVTVDERDSCLGHKEEDRRISFGRKRA